MQIMERCRFDAYIARFNAKDASAFDEYLSPDMRLRNGRLEYTGIEGMKRHYAAIWACMDETLDVLDYVTDGARAAVVMHTHFAVRTDAATSPFGPLRQGEAFDYHGVIFYEITRGRFSRIIVSYLDFVKTDTDGRQTSLGIVH
ncbi:MAG TPA: nuclear transport factor 2 family protein [Novosphingobium sp.]|nr:nuclear transport factor 2 family protein [Novosphingobium sp.]